ncbi:MAG: PIN domain-containing protein [Candidatus Limnocylindria bacterium]
MRILPDTSIWIDFFSGREPVAGSLEVLLRDAQLTTCGPVLAELLAGTPPRRQEALWLAVGSLPFVDLDQSAWREAGELCRGLRDRGRTVPLVDVLIAVASVRADAAVWTRYQDLARVQTVLPGLRLHQASN